MNGGLAGRQGYFVGEPDLLDADAGLVGEYDGAYHRSLAQQTADNAREEALEQLNLTVVRATAVDLWSQRQRLVQRILDGHARGHAGTGPGTAGGCRFGERDDDHLGRLGGFRVVGDRWSGTLILVGGATRRGAGGTPGRPGTVAART